jgi:hypothetical protein
MIENKIQFIRDMGFLRAYSSTLKMEATCSSDRRLKFNCIHGAIIQKIQLFKICAALYMLLSSGLRDCIGGELCINISVEHTTSIFNVDVGSSTFPPKRCYQLKDYEML